jgi:hypothetical protein
MTRTRIITVVIIAAVLCLAAGIAVDLTRSEPQARPGPDRPAQLPTATSQAPAAVPVPAPSATGPTSARPTPAPAAPAAPTPPAQPDGASGSQWSSEWD